MFLKSIVPQLGFLFKGTIQQNLDPNNDMQKYKLEEIVNKARNKFI